MLDFTNYSHTLACVLSHILLFATPWTVAPPGSSVHGISQADYWRGFPFPSPGDLLDSEIKPVSPVSPTFDDGFFTTEQPEKPITNY